MDCEMEKTQHPFEPEFVEQLRATFEERVAWVNETGLGVIGTPDEAVSQIERLVEQSGGFGCYLMMAHEWANPEATRRSYELFARYVMPRFQGSATRLQASERWSASVQSSLNDRQGQALKEWTEKHAAERAAKIWRDTLDAYEPPPIDDAVRSELGEFVVRRRAELGD